MNKTTIPSIDPNTRQWYLVDAEDQTLGRLATQVASVLRGKNKPHFTPHLDTGDFVVVVNAEKIRVTGRKSEQKLYRRHSGRPGGMKVETFQALQGRIPERIIEKAINVPMFIPVIVITGINPFLSAVVCPNSNNSIALLLQ